MPDKSTLRQYQSLPLSAKEVMSKNRIREWYNHWDGDVCISFSGGKDSTVLAHLVHDMYPNVPMIFVNTGLEYPEVRQFAEKMGAKPIYPRMRFDEVISTYGYPIISKENSEAIMWARKRGEGKTINQKREELLGERKTVGGNKSAYNKEKWLPLCQETMYRISNKCCSVMKKQPFERYQRQSKLYPYIGTLTDESRLREQKWLKHGCNAYDGDKKTSQPISFWKEQDVLHYIQSKSLEISTVYGRILAVDSSGYTYEPLVASECNLQCEKCQRTGCIFCGFGAHRDQGETRFQLLAKTHPRQYEYCMFGGQWVDNPEYDSTAPRTEDGWRVWNPKKIWVPSKKGLGMKKVFDDCNQIYGKDFIRYE